MTTLAYTMPEPAPDWCRDDPACTWFHDLGKWSHSLRCVSERSLCWSCLEPLTADSTAKCDRPDHCDQCLHDCLLCVREMR